MDVNTGREKKPSKEDTWKTADLRRQLREAANDHISGRRTDSERRHRGGESTERRHRDPEKEARRERDKQRRDVEERDAYDRRKEGSRDRRGDKDRDRREDREKRRDRDADHRDRRPEREQRERDRHAEDDRQRRREEREKDRRREEHDRERRAERERERERERRRHEDGERGERHHREHRDQPRDRDRRKEDSRREDRERRERHEERKHSEPKGERGHYEDEHRRHKEERERRHRERDEKQRREQERAEEEKRRERKHREDAERRHREDAERSHGDHLGSVKAPVDTSPIRESKPVKAEKVAMPSEQLPASVRDVEHVEEPVVNEEDSAYPEYEDDFEKPDYEEDFEELDESENEEDGEKEQEREEEAESGEADEAPARSSEEVNAIQRAIDEENERVGAVQSRQSTSGEEEDRPRWSKRSAGREEEEKPKWSRADTGPNKSKSPQSRKFIDFEAAKRREVSKKTASKQKKRSTELLRLIDLDFSMTFSLLDLPPVNEYDMYIRNFGAANTMQAYVQCNEDNVERDIQTDETEMCDKWSQHPPELSGACGDPNLPSEAQSKTMSELKIDSQRLTAFLRSASQVMVVLLEEERAERKSLSKMKTQKDALSFSDGSLRLNTKLPFLDGRPVSLVNFSSVQQHTMISVHKPTGKTGDFHLDSCTIICVWNIWEPSRPKEVLVYESEVQCCCFSPGKSSLVFAGTCVGSVVLWDLREYASNHSRLQIGDDRWTFRRPTFSTDAVMSSSAHFSPVTSVEVVPSTMAGDLRSEVPTLASEEESAGLLFQLASLDESGVLNFWVVVQLSEANEAGSQTDLGLRPGGKVKLLHSSTHFAAERVSSRGAVKTGTIQTLNLKFLPTDTNRFFIGTNMGQVIHGTSHGLKASPKFYCFRDSEDRPVDITALHFSPFQSKLFLAGCGDGSIRLHAVSRQQPVEEWNYSTSGQAVVALQWSQTMPTLFCALDAASKLYVWNLLKSDAEPVASERINTDRVTSMAVFGDSRQQNTYSGVALAHESGKIEMHFFAKEFSEPTSAAEEKLERLLTEGF